MRGHITMRKIREVLRLKFALEMGNQKIANSLAISSSTVHECLRRANLTNLNWPLPDDLDDEALEKKLYLPSRQKIPTEDREKSSGNVFTDIGVPEAEEYLAKTKLAYQINRLIADKGLKQIEAAKLLDIDQPKISALACGRLSGFSMERLFKFLAILNQDIVIMIKPHDQRQKRG